MRRESSKSNKNWPNRSQFWFRTLKTMPIKLQWSNFDFEKKIKIVRQFSLNGVQIIKICPKIKGWLFFCVLNVVNSKLYTKNSAISLFFGLLQQFSWELSHDFYPKSKSDQYSSVGVVSKYKPKNGFLVDQFLLDFDHLHKILTRIVSQIWPFLHN